MLEIADLWARYGQSSVLRGLNLSVPSSTTFGILGRNGAGKTTLAKSILGYGPRTRGRVTFDGSDLGRLATHARARLGLQLVPEDRRIYTQLTVRENLSLARSASGDRKPLNEDELIELFPMLARLIDRAGRALSGGEQQIVAIARATIPRPKLLIMDEPTEGLAPVIVDELARAVASLKSWGVTLVIVEQNVSFVMDNCDVVAIMGEGQVQIACSPEELDLKSDLVRMHLSV